MPGKYRNSILWLLVIIVLTLIPLSNPSGIERFPHWFDKIVHFVLFAVFSVLLMSDFIKDKKVTSGQLLITVIVFTAGFIIGITTELTQHFLIRSRTGSVYDLIADMAGQVTGIIVYKMLKTK